MTQGQRRSPEPLRDILYQFSLAKEVPDAELLDEYVRLYPEYAEALTDFAVQLVVDCKRSEPSESPAPATRVSPVVSRAMSRFQNAMHAVKAGRAPSPATDSAAAAAENPFSKVGRQDFRRIASELRANAVFLCMVRDGMVVFVSMPAGFLAALAAAMKVPVEVVTAYLRTQRPTVAAGQFCKADDKPQAGPQITFEEAVKRSGLTPEQQRYLLSL